RHPQKTGAERELGGTRQPIRPVVGPAAIRPASVRPCTAVCTRPVETGSVTARRAATGVAYSTVDPAIAALRVTSVNRAAIASRGRYVLYWMIAARRTGWSFALDHAIARAVELGRPLVVLEALRAGYRWASDRMHAFVLHGMADNARAFGDAGITYLPYVEPA